MSLQHDLTMEFCQPARSRIRNLAVTEYIKIDDYVVYKVEVHVQELSWSVLRRYREFHRLHEVLVHNYNIPWEILPPKKLVGNLKTSHLEKRRTQLEKYLNKILQLLKGLPRALKEFLEMDQFDVNAVCQQLAMDLFEIGDDVLARNLVFKLTPLQIHCINRRLQLPMLTAKKGSGKADIGHLYSFIHQVKRLSIYPGIEANVMIGHEDLVYDLTIFKSLRYVEIRSCDIELLEGVESLQENAVEVRIHNSLQLMKDFIISSTSWSQGILTTVCTNHDTHSEIMNQFPSWRKLAKASFSYNKLHSIDYSITLLPQLQELDLSHNKLTEVQFLEELMLLSKLDLSHNKISRTDGFSYKLPNISELNLSSNCLAEITGLEKLCSLEVLDISQNKIHQVDSVLCLGTLPLLHLLNVAGNPLTGDAGNYKERIWVQFSHRAIEVSIDGSLPTKREMSKVRESLAAQEKYDIIPDTVVESRLTPITRSPPERPTKHATPSPRVKKKDRIAKISSPTTKSDDTLMKLENEEASFRDKIEKMRSHAGDSWLSFYNEMNEQTEKPDEGETCTPASLEKKQTLKEQAAALKKTAITSTSARESGLIAVEEIDLELSDDLRREVKAFLRNTVDLNNETFLVAVSNGDVVEERMIAIDLDLRTFFEIDFNSGSTLRTYTLDSVRGLVLEENDRVAMFRFEARPSSKKRDSSHVLVKFRTQSFKDSAGLYVLLKSFGENRIKRHSSVVCSTNGSTLINNPFNIPSQLLIAYLQEFIRKNNKKLPTPPKRSTNEHSNYENVSIGQSFLHHDVSMATQDIVSIMWVGCLPYLFPDEEIPVCVVLTTVNMFLFRLFYPDSNSSECAEHVFSSGADLQEAFHCFYSFPLAQLREIVVGMFDQSVRIEVADEGSRGTFVFLTRDASKTSLFLDAISSVRGSKDDSQIDIVAKERWPNVVYPDSAKINALKTQLCEQDLSPLDDRENLISYCIVYERRHGDSGCYSYDESTLPYLRSLVLTNVRLILCDEDYAHWPLPSYVYSSPLTPQWTVDDVETVDDVIGVNLWDDMRGKQSMIGCHGVSMTFESMRQSADGTVSNRTNVWNLLFQSVAEREQLVRSLSCLWKNNFDQDLSITYSKTSTLQLPSATSLSCHSRNLSGNIKQPLDNPAALLSVDRSRLNEIFREKISMDEDESVQYVVHVGCKAINYPDAEFNLALVLGKYSLYLIASEDNKEHISAKSSFLDHNSVNRLYVATLLISALKQVVVGLFDQCFRLETGVRSETFVFVTRDFDRTNEFLQRLSQAILQLPKITDDVVVEQNENFEIYKKQDSDNGYPKSEFTHPNSRIKFVYPSDDSLSKLRFSVLQFLKDDFPEVDENFRVILYALAFHIDGNVTTPNTVVLSEKLLCLIKEDHVNYPLPLYATELPQRPQYEIVKVQSTSSLVRVEFDEFHSGAFTLLFTSSPLSLAEPRFETKTLEAETGDLCVVTEEKLCVDERLIQWKLQLNSYGEREKVFTVLSKLWTDCFPRKQLSILKQKSKT